MNNRQKLNTVKLIYSILQQRGLNKYFLGALCVCIGCFATFAFVFLFTALDVFGSLMYGAMVMGIAVGIVGIIWHIREALKQIKRDTR